MKQNDSRRKIGIFGSVPIFAIPLTTHNELKALVAISSFQGIEEFAFPSMDKLALRADLSLSALSKAVTGLVKKELVSRKKRYGHSNIYFLLYKTESQDEIKAENKKVAAMQRARNKRKNSDALNQLDNRNKQDKHALNQLDVDALNKQDVILKEHLKEQDKIQSTPALSEQLKELALKHNLTYSINQKEQNLFLNKLMIDMSLTNDAILNQALRFFEIVKRDPKLNWIHEFSFGFKFLQWKWDNIDAWHNKNKPQVVRMIPKGDFVAYAVRNTPPTLEELERMCK